MKEIIIQKLKELIIKSQNEKADQFIATKLGDMPTLSQIQNLLTKVQEDVNN